MNSVNKIKRRNGGWIILTRDWLLVNLTQPPFYYQGCKVGGCYSPFPAKSSLSMMVALFFPAGVICFIPSLGRSQCNQDCSQRCAQPINNKVVWSNLRGHYFNQHCRISCDVWILLEVHPLDTSSQWKWQNQTYQNDVMLSISLGPPSDPCGPRQTETRPSSSFQNLSKNMGTIPQFRLLSTATFTKIGAEGWIWTTDLR